MVPFGRTAAIFDVDDSLLDGNAGTIFTCYLYSEKVMRAEQRSRIPRTIYEYARHRLSEQDMVEVGSRCQQGLYADDLKAHAHRCLGRHLRVHAAIGTRTRIVDGRATDQIVPPVVFRDGKREAVEALADKLDLDLAKSFLYSDSNADVPLFEAVGNAVVVNPKAPFREIARRRGWEIVEWKERNRPGAEPDLADEWGSWGG